MESADDGKLGDRPGGTGGSGFEGFFEGHGVSAGRVFLAAKRTQAAGGNAYVRRIDMAIHVEVGAVAVHALADVVCHPTDGEDIAGAVKCESVLRVEALAGKHFGVNRLQ